MTRSGFASRERWVCGALVSLWVVVVGGSGCSPEVTSDNPQTSESTVGVYCDQLLPAFCTYAVTTCGLEGSVVLCIDNARPTCCQGACSRPARLVKDLEACKVAYAGRDAGVDDAGLAVEAVAGQPCSNVLAGLSPVACQDVVELLATPAVDGAQ